MVTANPYLHFDGNCEEAFNFYKSILGGEFSSFQRYNDMPSEQPFPEGDRKKIMHIGLPLSEGFFILGSDVPSSYQVIKGTNFYISLNTDSEAEATRIFNAFSGGGQVTMPLAKTFWGAFFGMLIDRFQIQWMVSYHYK